MMKSPSHQLTESVFASSDALAGLDAPDRDVLLSLIADRPQTLSKGQDLTQAAQGAPIGWVLLDGWAARYKLLPDGRRQILTFFLPGDIVDPLRAVAPRKDFSVMSITDVLVAAFRSDRLLDTTASAPGLRTLIARLMTREQELLAEHLLSVGRRTAREAVAHLILELVSRLRRGGSSESTLTMPITQSEIGDALGLSTVHVNRTLRELEIDGRSSAAAPRWCWRTWTPCAALPVSTPAISATVTRSRRRPAAVASRRRRTEGPASLQSEGDGVGLWVEADRQGPFRNRV